MVMDFVLLSARGDGPVPHWSRAIADTAAVALAGQGARVYWLCSLGRHEPEPGPRPGVVIEAVVGRVPSFRRVRARTSDPAMDVRLARLLRPLVRAVVAHIGFGAPGSVTTLWLAERMGARAVAVVRAAEVLCHRQTLVHAGGQTCTDFSDPGRCRECIAAPAPAQQAGQGLSTAEAWLARRLRPLGGWSPFPGPGQFLARADLTLAGLLSALVLTRSAVERQQLLESGLVDRNVRDTGSSGATANGEALAQELLGLGD